MSVTPTVLPADPQTLPTEVPKPTPSASISKTVLVTLGSTPTAFHWSRAPLVASPTPGTLIPQEFSLYSPNGRQISTHSISSLLMLSVYVSV